MARIQIFFWLLIVPLLPLHPQSIPVSSFELPNGLKVILAPSNGLQSAAVCVYHMRGARHDPVVSRCISYLYQYLMFDGNENLEPLDHILFINKMGGVVSGRVKMASSPTGRISSRGRPSTSSSLLNRTYPRQ